MAFPTVIDELSGQRVDMIETFPPEHRDRIRGISTYVMARYTPVSLERKLYEKIDQRTIVAIKSEIATLEQDTISLGGRSIKNEMLFRFGLREI